MGNSLYGRITFNLTGMKNIFFFAAGFLLARYLIYNVPDSKAKEAQEIDAIRNKVHDLIKKYAPEADDVQVGNDVMNTI
jgi:hypothetical protein